MSATPAALSFGRIFRRTMLMMAFTNACAIFAKVRIYESEGMRVGHQTRCKTAAPKNQAKREGIYTYCASLTCAPTLPTKKCLPNKYRDGRRNLTRRQPYAKCTLRFGEMVSRWQREHTLAHIFDILSKGMQFLVWMDEIVWPDANMCFDGCPT